MKYVVLTAILLHFLTKLFWDYGVDYSYRGRLDRALKSGNIEEVKLSLEGIEREETPAYDRYSLGIAAVIFLWVIASQSRKRLSDKMIVVLEWWSFWAISDVIKELSHMFNVLTWLFANPTYKYLSEYIIFFVSTIYILYKLRRQW